MKIFVKVKPNAKAAGIERTDDIHFVVKVKEPPREGRANEAVMSAIADYLDVSKSRVSIISGGSSSNKIIEISGF